MKLLRTLHAWAGAILALLLIVEGLTGALLVLKPDYLRLVFPQARAAASTSPQVIGRAVNALERVHHGHLERVTFASKDLGLHQVFFMHDTYGYAGADGRLIAEWSGNGRPETLVYNLHHFLLMGETGMTVAGYGALAACVIALVGLIVWLPVWKGWRPNPWPRSAKRRDLIAAHRNLGALFVLPVVLFCLTGGAIIFYKQTQAILTKAFPGPAAEEFFPPIDVGDIDWVRALGAAQAKFPQARLRMVFWPEGIWAPAVVRLKQPGDFSPDGETEVLIDPSTSRVIGVKDSAPLGLGVRIYNAILPTHAALIGGRGYDLLAFLTGLALAAMGGIGLWSFLAKYLRRKA